MLHRHCLLNCFEDEVVFACVDHCLCVELDVLYRTCQRCFRSVEGSACWNLNTDKSSHLSTLSDVLTVYFQFYSTEAVWTLLVLPSVLILTII